MTFTNQDWIDSYNNLSDLQKNVLRANLDYPKNGTVYFVDGNSGDDTNEGTLGWEAPLKTLEAAFTASHADIARGSDRWARRNTIYVAGDSFEEDLIILPQKTDVIGVGSYNGHSGPNILGNHVPANAGFGCRFFNVNFEPVAADDIFTLTGVTWGFELHKCTFRASGTLVAVSAVDMTAVPHTRIIGCRFLGGFTGDVIDIGAGAVDDIIIRGNEILGGDNDGIIVTGTTTVTAKRTALIADNYIQVDNVTIDDGADGTFNVVNNRCISAGALGTTSHVITVAMASGNIVTGNGVQISVPAMTGVGA